MKVYLSFHKRSTNVIDLNPIFKDLLKIIIKKKQYLHLHLCHIVQMIYNTIFAFTLGGNETKVIYIS